MRIYDERLLTFRSRFDALPLEARETALIKGLGHQDPVVREACAEILENWPSPHTTPAMLAALGDAEPIVRLHAASHFVFTNWPSKVADPRTVIATLTFARARETDEGVARQLETAVEVHGQTR